MGEKKSLVRSGERKSQNLHIRATKAQVDLLEMLSYENEKTKTDMIWKALEFYHNFKKGSLN